MSSGSKRDHFGHMCLECDAPADVAHHIIPHSLGGRRTVPLCDKCHNLVHGGGVGSNHSALTRAGIERARLSGKQIGNTFRKINLDEVQRLRDAGKTWFEIRVLTGYPESTIREHIKRLKKS